MTPDHDKARLLRRYVLGELPDEEHAAIEQEYFVDDDALEQVSSAEDELIEDYLEHRLDAGTRDRFERHYLSTPGHRTRVSVMQGLMSAAARKDVSPAARADSRRRGTAARWSPFRQAALAASIALLVGVGAVWLFTARQVVDERQATTSPGAAPKSAQAPPSTPSSPGALAQAPPPSTSARAPVVVALSLSPIVVRGAGAAPTMTIPADADILMLRLQGDANDPPLRRGRAVVRTVEGDVLWRGPIDTPRDTHPDLRAIVRIPAARLRTGDLIVELHGIDADGRESEQTRYTVNVKMTGRQ